MAYIGVSPSNGVRRVHTYTATASQTIFSGAGAEGTTLSYKDSNFVDVYQNGIKLADADYTSTSGTQIVLAQAASVNDIVVVVVFDVFSVSDTVSKADGGTFDGNVTMGGTLGVTGVPTFTGRSVHSGGITIANGGQIGSVGDADAMSISSSGVVTFTQTPVGAGGNNSPYFYGKKASAQTIVRNATTRITGFTGDELDSDSAFDGTTFTVPSGKAGRYYFHANVHNDFTSIGSDGERALLYFYKNGGSEVYNDFFIGSGYNVAQVSNSYSFLINLSAGDYIELYIYNKDGNAGGNAEIAAGSFFLGYRLA